MDHHLQLVENHIPSNGRKVRLLWAAMVLFVFTLLLMTVSCVNQRSDQQGGGGDNGTSPFPSQSASDQGQSASDQGQSASDQGAPKPGETPYGAGGSQPEAPPEYPTFPWPPPQATSATNIPSELLVKPAEETTRLSDVDQNLSDALESQRYYEKSYYAVPDGFAMATRLEQFLQDGTSEEPPDRWAAEVRPLNDFSLREYIRRLFRADPGYYRVIVFIITPHPLVQKEETVSRDEATEWVTGGANKLPESIGSAEYTEDYTTTALVYEFVQPERDEEASLRQAGESSLTARDHLVKAKLWGALGG